jgi:hypothetical protein
MMTKKLNYRDKAEAIPWKNRCASKVFINPRTRLVSVLQINGRSHSQTIRTKKNNKNDIPM